MKVKDAKFVKDFIKMANDGWLMGWHERNGGNLSYRLKKEEVEAIKENFNYSEWNEIGTSVPYLKNEFFLVTGSGKYFRNVILDLEDSCCVIELDDKGEKYRICWGLVNGKYKWPRDSDEAKQITKQEFRWLMEGLSIEQKTAIRPAKTGAVC